MVSRDASASRAFRLNWDTRRSRTAALSPMPSTFCRSSAGAFSTAEREPYRSIRAWAMGVVSLRGMA